MREILRYSERMPGSGNEENNERQNYAKLFIASVSLECTSNTV
jgi:hypothetical protein